MFGSEGDVGKKLLLAGNYFPLHRLIIAYIIEKDCYIV